MHYYDFYYLFLIAIFVVSDNLVYNILFRLAHFLLTPSSLIVSPPPLTHTQSIIQ